MPANVEVPVAPNDDAVIPPAKVEVAVVVALMEPTVTCDEVAWIDVPLNHKSAEESCDALVPPFAIGKIPVTSAARSMSAVVMSPATPFKNPEMEPILSPCDWI